MEIGVDWCNWVEHIFVKCETGAGSTPASSKEEIKVLEALAKSVHVYVPGIENSADLTIMGTMLFFVIVGTVYCLIKKISFF